MWPVVFCKQHQHYKEEQKHTAFMWPAGKNTAHLAPQMVESGSWWRQFPLSLGGGNNTSQAQHHIASQDACMAATAFFIQMWKLRLRPSWVSWSGWYNWSGRDGLGMQPSDTWFSAYWVSPGTEHHHISPELFHPEDRILWVLLPHVLYIRAHFLKEDLSVLCVTHETIHEVVGKNMGFAIRETKIPKAFKVAWKWNEITYAKA